ncbi:fumarylacetoacetate hydrolase family protein [Microbacterium sp. CFH 90308]|uniref:Fumarylacetoacetate hydrolase family protein n=1 Tax=Microbacterium salsuginis TaxID=2722803 RepID=A0ABX1KAW6_9MICO|nr:fumarylacetoacetate hydrolase family protein [Microbacterium sp. CFH 90308]NLP84177.1 fumarylacetoacetate hydrolase family protein [Microbacterium sp. CFH 90308]
MQLFRIGDAGREIPVARVEESTEVFDLRPLGDDLDPEFFVRSIDRAAQAIHRGELSAIATMDELRDVRRGAPLVRPAAVVCVGMNYAAHAAESGAEPPTVPVVFFKHPNTITGPDDPIALPPESEALDWEVELGIVIGQRARYLDSPGQSPQHIAGFVISNDVSERDWQLSRSGGQWSKGKTFESFNPLGPILRTPDGFSPTDLRLRSWVNGEPRQDSSTADLIFDVNRIVYELSQFMVLEPGDLINTGTPEGVGLSGRFPYLRPGDTVACEIDGLGRQEQRVVLAADYRDARRHG